jgi:16S rRNA (guanine527-N7)-methyltransferase
VSAGPRPDPAATAPPVPATARLFGDRLPLAVRYAERLATVGVERGLLGPREADRVWERHVLNSAVLAELLPASGAPLEVVDAGAGAGLPGIPLLLAAPGLSLLLVEPMLRRAVFLEETVELLGLSARVVRGRVEELPAASVDVVVARAVAPLGRLLELTLPVLRPGGLLLALKGRGAAGELASAQPVLRRWPDARAGIATVGAGIAPATVVRVERHGGVATTRRRATR